MPLFGKRAEPSRAAGVYLHPETLLLHAEHRAKSGILKSAAPVIRLQPNEAPEHVGRALRQVLSAYRDGVEDSTNWSEHSREFLRHAGFRSWKALETKSRSCWIQETATEIIFTPLHNGGRSGDQKGFQPFGAIPLKISVSASDAELGSVLLAALQAST